MNLNKIGQMVRDAFRKKDTRPRTFIGRRRFSDVDYSAFAFRMPAGFPGDVSRVHPVSVEPCLIDPAQPPAAYGYPVIGDNSTTNGVRGFKASDTGVTVVWGVTVRPFPAQQQSGNLTSSFGAGTPPTTGEIDVMRSGYIMASIPSGVVVNKGSPVFVWCAASTGAHVQGGFEGAASGGNTAALDVNKYQFNGPADSSGNVEVCCNV